MLWFNPGSQLDPQDYRSLPSAWMQSLIYVLVACNVGKGNFPYYLSSCLQAAYDFYNHFGKILNLNAQSDFPVIVCYLHFLLLYSKFLIYLLFSSFLPSISFILLKTFKSLQSLCYYLTAILCIPVLTQQWGWVEQLLKTEIVSGSWSLFL